MISATDPSCLHEVEYHLSVGIVAGLRGGVEAGFQVNALDAERPSQFHPFDQLTDFSLAVVKLRPALSFAQYFARVLGAFFG